jgi:hypothetical protein
MQTIRRLYVYLVAFISLEVVLWSVIGLVRYVLGSGGFGQDTNRLSISLALLLVSAPVFGLHWWLAQRSAAGDIQERSDRLRAIFIFGTLLATLIPAVQNALAALSRLFLQAFSVEPFRAMFGGIQTLPDNLVAILINLLAAGYFYWVVRSDGRLLVEADASQEYASQYADAWLDTRRWYRYIWLLYGLAMVVFGLQQTLLAVLTIWRAQNTQPWAQLGNGLALLLVGVPLWYFIERLLRRSLADPAEKVSLLRLAILYLLVFIGLVVMLASAGTILYDILRGIFGAFSFGTALLGEIAQPSSLLLPFGLVWIYYGRKLRLAIDVFSELSVEAEQTQQRRLGLRRLYYYFASLAGLISTFVGMAAILNFVISLAIDPVFWTTPTLRDSLALGISALVIGLPVWIWAWRPMAEEASRENESGDHARRSVIRRGYLFLVLFVGVLGVMFSSGALLYQLIESFFGNPSQDLLYNVLQGLALIALFTALLIIHWRVLRKDNRLALRTLSRRYAQFPVLILTPDDLQTGGEQQPGIFSRSLVDAIQRLTPDLPVAVHSYSLGVPDETLSAAQAVILPAELIAQPSEAYRLWLQAYPGQRLVIPMPARNWIWVGKSRQGIPALARQTAQLVRQLAEGEPPGGDGETSPWMTVLYFLAALLGLLLLIVLITTLLGLFAA